MSPAGPLKRIHRGCQQQRCGNETTKKTGKYTHRHRQAQRRRAKTPFHFISSIHPPIQFTPFHCNHPIPPRSTTLDKSIDPRYFRYACAQTHGQTRPRTFHDNMMKRGATHLCEATVREKFTRKQKTNRPTRGTAQYSTTEDSIVATRDNSAGHAHEPHRTERNQETHKDQHTRQRERERERHTSTHTHTHTHLQTHKRGDCLVV